MFIIFEIVFLNLMAISTASIRQTFLICKPTTLKLILQTARSSFGQDSIS